MTQPPGSIVHGPKAASLSQLPSVDRLVQHPGCAELIRAHGAVFVTQQARTLLAQFRRQLLDGVATSESVQDAALVQALKESCEARLAPRMKRVINLTGTTIHTNLGRAVLAPAAIDHVALMMAGPNNLEFDLDSGSRGDRDSVVEDLICEITGAEAATVVNNNAAAVLLTIAALGYGREVIVSRGELVEIGGAFRMPDVMASAGAHMVEVGTTNRTHLKDYERAINPKTALIMKVHTSNYAVQGFTSSVAESELAPLARSKGVLLATDLGSGSLLDLSAYGLPKEPMPQDMIKAGCDVVTFSGDKLLGGPQAGLIAGRREVIERIRRFPMKRALRVSKLPLAALEATLKLYLRPDRLLQELPTVRWLTRPKEQMQAMAHVLLPHFAQALSPRYSTQVVDLLSQIGSGSLPVERMPSCGLGLVPTANKAMGRELEALSRALRQLPRPVVGRIEKDRLLLDLRCLDHPEELLEQLPALRSALVGSVNS